MLIQTFPQGLRLIQGDPNIVVSIVPGKEVIVDLMSENAAEGLHQISDLTRGQDAVTLALAMLEKALRHHANRRPAE